MIVFPVISKWYAYANHIQTCLIYYKSTDLSNIFPGPALKKNKQTCEWDWSGKLAFWNKKSTLKMKSYKTEWEMHAESCKAHFITRTPEKSLTLLMFVLCVGPRAKTPSGRDLNCYPEAFQHLNQKVYSITIQLILLLLIPDGLQLLSLHSRPSDTAYHSSTNSQRILNSMTQVRLNPSR